MHEVWQLLNDRARRRRMVDDAETEDQVELLFGIDQPANLLGIALNKARLETIDVESLTRHVEAFVRELDNGEVRAMSSEIDRVGTNPTTYLEHAFATPPAEIGKRRNVRLDEVLSLFDFIEIQARAKRLHGVSNITRPTIPVLLDKLYSRTG